MSINQFDNVVKEIKNWLTSFGWINTLIPFSLILMFGGLGISFINDFFILINLYLPLFSFAVAIGHYAFLLGFWLCLISPNAKFTPYALFAKAFLYLFPFTNIYMSSLIHAAVYAYLGYWLLKYTALSLSYNQNSDSDQPM